MKFKTERVELDPDVYGVTNDDQQLWIDIPKGVTEGFVRTMTADRPEMSVQDGQLESNWMILGLVRAWNLDDDEGVALPVPKTVQREAFNTTPEFDAERKRIMAAVPMPLYEFIASKVVNRPSMSEGVRGN